IASLKHENKILVKSLRKRDEGHAEILSHGDKASSDFSTDNKEALSSNYEVEMAINETVMDSTEAFTIKDVENVIEDLKSKVTRAEGQTDSVEDKCMILSEANDDLKKELSFVKGRVRCLETSLH
nr:WPP domain-interacting tail-anchored protein 1 [Tanacetum cinerariifolium]